MSAEGLLMRVTCLSAEHHELPEACGPRLRRRPRPLRGYPASMAYREPPRLLHAVYTTFNNIVRAIDCATGAVLWEYLTDDLMSDLMLFATTERLLVVQGARLVALDASSGVVVWKATLEGASSAQGQLTRVEVHGDAVLVSREGRLRAFALEDGRERWSAKVKRWAVPQA